MIRTISGNRFQDASPQAIHSSDDRALKRPPSFSNLFTLATSSVVSRAGAPGLVFAVGQSDFLWRTCHSESQLKIRISSERGIA